MTNCNQLHIKNQKQVEKHQLSANKQFTFSFSGPLQFSLLLFANFSQSFWAHFHVFRTNKYIANCASDLILG